MKKKILIVVGTRPNFIKITQFKKIAPEFPALEIKIVHTGQHYDKAMSDVFFQQFQLSLDFHLNLPASGLVAQMAAIMTGLEEILLSQFKADLVMVVGDVNSTLAAAITAHKLNIPLAHLESGLRSFDLSMPEENNRILTDAITDYFFVTEESGMLNLLSEGKEKSRIFFTGNTMIDTLVAFEKEIQNSDIEERLDLQPQKYVLMTIHRPSNVDDKQGLEKLLLLIKSVAQTYKIIFPIHPRSLRMMQEFGLAAEFKSIKNLSLVDALDYISFQKLILGSKFIITDSGGIQEESTFCGIPCLTLRRNTERPVTCSTGTNTLVDHENIFSYITTIENSTYKKGTIPEFWDGQASHRTLKILQDILTK